jgi:biopolymer transport protein TolR
MAMGLASSGGRGRGRRTRRAPMAEINVTPFVDVMLVLLIIFMVTAPLMASGVPIDLPDSRADALEQEPDQITVALDASGAVFVDDQPVESGALELALAEASRANPEKPLVTLRADRALDWGRVMSVMGELNRAGFSQISLVSNSSAEAP